MSDSFEGVPHSIMCWTMILTSLWLEVRMSNSRASLASDYLDNFYASLPPRSSTYLIFWILAQFFCTKVVNMSYILDLCPTNILSQADKWRACQAAPALILQTNAKNKLILKVPPWLLFWIAYFPFPTVLAFFVSQSLCALISLALLLILVLFTFLATPCALFLRTL